MSPRTMRAQEPSRVACVLIPALPLQLYLRDHPEHRGHPVAIVDTDRPQGVLLWTNEQARSAKILPGMRYGAALSLHADLRAGVVPEERTQEGVRHLHQKLLQFSPDVEVQWEEPGVFWLNAEGLTGLYPSLLAWVRSMREPLLDDGFFATIVVGFSRFGTYALAKSRPGYGVCKNVAEEQDQLQSVPLDRISILPTLRDALAKLGVYDVGALRTLPLAGLRRRFGPELYRLARLGLAEFDEPLSPYRPEEPIRSPLLLEAPETDASRLLFLIKSALHDLLRRLSTRNEALQALKLQMKLERSVEETERQSHLYEVRPAQATLDAAQVADLVRLKLESISFGAGVLEIHLEAVGVTASMEQMRLFAETQSGNRRRQRDLSAAGRALSRIRARYGEDAVVHALLTEGHLPEAAYRWERIPLSWTPPPTGAEASAASSVRRVGHSLIRRIQSIPIPLPARPRQEPDGWMLRGWGDSPVVRMHGPFVISGGWWRGFLQREYGFVETQRGEMLWVYYDCRRRRWFLQGAVA